MSDLVEVGRFGAIADAEQRALVLAAVGIEAHLIADAGVVRLCVTSSEALRARHELGCYERENARRVAAGARPDSSMVRARARSHRAPSPAMNPRDSPHERGTPGEQVSRGAHVAGFAVGVVIGFTLAHATGRVAQGPLAQRIYGVLACGLFILAWLLALRG